MSVRRVFSRAKREDGAILPLVALLILVLFGFAALGVDASAAWAERREAQAAADAAVLAGALDYLDGDTPTGADLVAVVKSYVNKNWGAGKAPSDAAWASCTDSAKPAEYGAVDGIDCISLKQLGGEPALLRVKLPTYDMPTAFASIIGWNSVGISATATAELEYIPTTKVLPFSLPANPSTEECLSTPPAGLLPVDQATVQPCDGSTKGNFGMLDSPWFGAGDPHFTDTYDCNSTNFNTIAPHSVAVGLDHLITTHPSPQPAVGTSFIKNDTGTDTCATGLSGTIPYILNPKTGDSNGGAGGGRSHVQNGMIGLDPSPTAGTLPGRLRQGPSLAVANNRYSLNGISIDNVGLFEYLTDTSGNPNSNPCHVNNFSRTGPTGKEGRELTVQLVDCLESNPSGSIFSIDLLDSPRFAIVPVLNYSSPSDLDIINGTGQQGLKWWAVLELRPVFLHSTWYQCQSGRNPNECLFLPDDLKNDPAFDADSLDWYSMVLNPGEGTEPACAWRDPGCAGPTAQFKLLGLSALVLDWDLLPPGAENQYGSFSPYRVFLHDNE